jgi:hypothetical protein
MRLSLARSSSSVSFAFAKHMKRAVIIVAVCGVMLVAGFFGGRAVQSAKTGYHYRLLKQKEYESSLGPIQWSCFVESVGFPFLETEKTMINMGNRTIYKAQRDFQEDAPFAENIVTSSNSVAWDDGDFRYHLTVEPMKKGEPDGAGNSHRAGQ